ncbi:hypothetical protein ACGC1H_004048 [Rhizoctonia solani]|uniref:Uncharacterized protein n=1 Tax=Rhizoctonia solani TaxID=456999 RepID=A0A8H3BJR0_9AGAM|nr:unnamed protein product [Rhizoctonia solani]
MAKQIPVPASSGEKRPANAFRRIMMIPVLVFMIYLAFKSYTWVAVPKKPEIIYADRYSDQYKFRPAASPIITEKLTDGRIRIRGHDTRDL